MLSWVQISDRGCFLAHVVLLRSVVVSEVGHHLFCIHERASQPELHGTVAATLWDADRCCRCRRNLNTSHARIFGQKAREGNDMDKAEIGFDALATVEARPEETTEQVSSGVARCRQVSSGCHRHQWPIRSSPSDIQRRNSENMSCRRKMPMLPSKMLERTRPGKCD